MRKSLTFAALASATMLGALGAQAQSDRFAGTYGGLHGGYAFSARSDEVGVRNFATGVFVDNYGPLRPSGVFGGIQLGHNFRSGGLILGLEADVSAGKISTSRAETRSGLTVASKGELNGFGTLRAKVGVAVSATTLAYATAGVTFAKYDYQVAYSGALNGTLSKSDTALGWTVGAGMEFALDKSWSLKTEALYLNLLSARTINDGKISTIEHLQQGQLRLGLNYKF
jgi:outer membrane immunogenic protein